MFIFELIKLNTDEASICFNGDLDIEVTEMMGEQIYPSLVTFNKIDINMSGVPFVDSTGIGLLINLVDSLKKEKEEMTIIISNVQPQVKEIFDIIQLADILGEEIIH